MGNNLILKTSTKGNILVDEVKCAFKINPLNATKGTLILEIPVDNQGLSLIDSVATDDSITLSLHDLTSNKIKLETLNGEGHSKMLEVHLDESGLVTITFNVLGSKIGKTGS